MVDECSELYPRPNNPIPFERRRLLALLECFFEGDLDAALTTMAV
jgi:hypothetical protein